MIEFRPLTKEEAQSPVHFCGRCETWQKRGELHPCKPTERWKAAKAAMWAKNPMPPPCVTKPVHLQEPDPVHFVHSVHSPEPVHSHEPVHFAVEGGHPEVDKIEVDRVDIDPEEVDSDHEEVDAEVDRLRREESRREYEREYKRRKRAAARSTKEEGTAQ
jgi:hypothetical protein